MFSQLSALKCLEKDSSHSRTQVYVKLLHHLSSLSDISSHLCWIALMISKSMMQLKDSYWP